MPGFNGGWAVACGRRAVVGTGGGVRLSKQHGNPCRVVIHAGWAVACHRWVAAGAGGGVWRNTACGYPYRINGRLAQAVACGAVRRASNGGSWRLRRRDWLADPRTPRTTCTPSRVRMYVHRPCIGVLGVASILLVKCHPTLYYEGYGEIFSDDVFRGLYRSRNETIICEKI